MSSEYQNYSGTDPVVTEWATEAARSTILVRRISQVCFALAVAAIVFGLVAAISTYWTYDSIGSDPFSGGTNRTVGIAQGSNILVNALLPAGVLAAAGAFLRLQAIRFETDLYDNDDEADDTFSDAPTA